MCLCNNKHWLSARGDADRQLESKLLDANTMNMLRRLPVARPLVCQRWFQTQIGNSIELVDSMNRHIKTALSKKE